MNNENSVRARFMALREHLNERGRRLLAAAEAIAPDSDGIAAVSLELVHRELREARSVAASRICRIQTH